MNDVQILPTDAITEYLPPLPEIPDLPEIPEFPDITDLLEMQDTPDIPDITALLDMQNTPDKPDTTALLDMQDKADITALLDMQDTTDKQEITTLLDMQDLPEIPDKPDTADTADNVIIVPAAPLPITSECLSYPLQHSAVTVTRAHVTHESIPYRCYASDNTRTLVNVPIVTEASPTFTLTRRPTHTDSGPSAPKNQQTSQMVVSTRPPITGQTRLLTRISNNMPNLSSDSGQNQIKALLAEQLTPCRPHLVPPRCRNFTVTASSGRANIPNLPVRASMSANLPLATHVRPRFAQSSVLQTQRPSLPSAFVRTTSAAEFIPRTVTVDSDTVKSTHVTTTTAITTPMIAAALLTREATTTPTSVALTVTSSTGQSLVLISSPPPRTRAARATHPYMYVPVQHMYKAKPVQDAATSALNPLNLVRSKAIPPSTGASVASPGPITMLGPRGFITTTAGGNTLVQRPPAHTCAGTHHYTYLEPGQIKQICNVQQRSFSGPQSSLASAAPVLQKQAPNISEMKMAKHAQNFAELHTRSVLQLDSMREVQRATSLIALQEASHARLLAASQEARFKAQQQAAATRPAAAHSLPAPLQLPVTTQLQIAAFGQTQTVSRAQRHDTLNLQILNPTQAPLHATAQIQASSQDQINETLKSERQAYYQAQGQPIAASWAQDNFSATYLQHGPPLPTSQMQNQPLATSELQDQPSATPELQGHHLTTSQASTYNLTSSKPQGQHLAFSQAPTYILATSQAQDPIFVLPQRQSLMATIQSQVQLPATSQAQCHAPLRTQPNVAMQIKSTQPNATLIAQLNAPQQMIVTKGQQNFPRPLTVYPYSRQQRMAHGHPSPCTRHSLSMQTRNRPYQVEHRIRLDKTPVVQSSTNEMVAASASLNKQLPTTSSNSQQSLSSSPIHNTSTVSLPTSTTLIDPHYKSIVFKNLLSIGRSEPSQLPTPTTSSGELVVIRRPAGHFSPRRTFPITTQSFTAPPTTTSTATDAPVIHSRIIRTIPRGMIEALMTETENARKRREASNSSANPPIVYVINSPSKSKEEKKDEDSENNENK